MFKDYSYSFDFSLVDKKPIHVHMIMNDVGYYLADYSPKIDCVMYISQGQFFPVPGTYDLPFRSGRYVLYHDKLTGYGKVQMMTCGTSSKYVHDLVEIKDSNTVIHYGWYS